HLDRRSEAVRLGLRHDVAVRAAPLLAVVTGHDHELVVEESEIAAGRGVVADLLRLEGGDRPTAPALMTLAAVRDLGEADVVQVPTAAVDDAAAEAEAAREAVLGLELQVVAGGRLQALGSED